MTKLSTNSKTTPRTSFQARDNYKMSLSNRTFTTTSTHSTTVKELDAETGLYYYGARYLDPKMSRWLSVDPAMYQGDYIPSAPVNEEARKRNGNLPGQGGIFNIVNMHVYHYAGNNPVKYVDPDGRQPAIPPHNLPNNLPPTNIPYNTQPAYRGIEQRQNDTRTLVNSLELAAQRSGSFTMVVWRLWDKISNNSKYKNNYTQKQRDIHLSVVPTLELYKSFYSNNVTVKTTTSTTELENELN